MKYVFDTNVVLAYIRQNTISSAVTAILDLTDDNEVIISTVTVGELLSIANQQGWGKNKRAILHHLLDDYVWASVSDIDLLYRYAEIDAFSQNKLAGRPLNDSARNMGKNDLWIAASASLAGVSLITTDKDFNHLHGQFLDVIWIDPDKTK
jgi:tRNA(fMet)-specific endonuclease VapC